MNTIFGAFVAIGLLITVTLALRQVGIFYVAKTVRIVAEKNSIVLSEERLDQMLVGASFFTLLAAGVVFSILFLFRRGWTEEAVGFSAQYAEKDLLPVLRGDTCEREPEEEP